jgi:hypothetical protein
MPASAARGCSQATAPRVPKTVERPLSRDVAPVGFSSLPAHLQLPSQFTGFAQGYSGAQQRKLCRRLILGPAKGIYVGGTLISILISLYLFISGRRESGIFVGLWAPTVLNLGQTLFEGDES